MYGPSVSTRAAGLLRVVDLQGPVTCVLALDQREGSEVGQPLVMTGSADSTIKVWDPLKVKEPGRAKDAPCIQVRASGVWTTNLIELHVTAFDHQRENIEFRIEQHCDDPLSDYSGRLLFPFISSVGGHVKLDLAAISAELLISQGLALLFTRQI